uniref:hypothetical protein n=1 Tax=Methanoculleus sp. TaxID=90427 RepID=UPI0025F61952
GLAYWIIGTLMMIISWFFWPSPAVALIGVVGLLAYAGDPENLPLLAVNVTFLAAAVFLWRLRSRGEGPYKEF